MLFDGDAAAIVFDRDGAIVVDGDADVVGEAGQGLVDGVIDHFVHQVVQAAAGVVADVHAEAFADVLEIGEMLQVGGGVLFGGGGGGFRGFNGCVGHVYL